MVKLLYGEALETYCRRLGFKEETQDMIVRIRSSPPSRSPRGREGNVCVWVPQQEDGRYQLS